MHQRRACGLHACLAAFSRERTSSCFKYPRGARGADSPSPSRRSRAEEVARPAYAGRAPYCARAKPERARVDPYVLKRSLWTTLAAVPQDESGEARRQPSRAAARKSCRRARNETRAGNSHQSRAKNSIRHDNDFRNMRRLFSKPKQDLRSSRTRASLTPDDYKLFSDKRLSTTVRRTHCE